MTRTKAVYFRDRGGVWGDSLIQQMLMELSICVGYCLGTGDSVVNKIESLLSRDYILVEEMNKNKQHNVTNITI